MNNVLVFVSIVIGLGVADLLVSFHRLLRARRKVSWDWAPLVVALLALLTILKMWWEIAQPGAKSLTIGAFLPTLVELVLLFLLASATLPDEVPAEGLDLKAYYHEQGAYIWTLFAAALGWLVTVGVVALSRVVGFPQALASQADELLVLAVMGSLIFVRARWWHLIAILLLSSGPLGWLSRSLS